MHPALSDLESLARGAGEILRTGFSHRPGFGRRLQIEYKSLLDPVTEADHLSETYLLQEIQRRFPEHRVMTEESGERSGLACCQWIIDPLDGTVNYAHGVPIFCVSIAYAEDGVVQLGAIYEPMLDECFSAQRGCGAWLNGEPIQASITSNLDQSLLVTGFSYDIRTNPNNNLDNYIRFSLSSQAVRRMGSAALDLCYVAAGRFDGYWEIRIKPWDIAAGGLIASEAGAVVSNIHGCADYLAAPQSILAANPLIYPQMLRMLNSGHPA